MLCSPPLPRSTRPHPLRQLTTPTHPALVHVRAQLLVEAAMSNDVVRCQKLIDRGEEMNEALHYAVGRGRLEIVNLLIEVSPSAPAAPTPVHAVSPVCAGGYAWM